MEKEKSYPIDDYIIDCCSIDNTIDQTAKRFIDIYIDNLLSKFRLHCSDKFTIKIFGLERFIDKDNSIISFLINRFNELDYCIDTYSGERGDVDKLTIFCLNETKCEHYEYKIQHLPSIFELSSRTNIPVAGLIMMRIVAQTILKNKIIYKAIVLDLDDTLWCGTLAEDGFEKIEQNLKSECGKPFIAFMNFIKVLANELGIFIAVCSRNDDEQVKKAIDSLDENVFPLKNQIDCLIANYNDKSENLKKIAETLSILPQAIIFIDDNPIIIDEVRKQLPEVFVPQWDNHSDLTTQLIAGCFFERNELSLSSRERRGTIRILQNEKKKNNLPNLLISVTEDDYHSEAIKLYAKSNQFKFTQNNKDFDTNCKSLCFKLYRDNGESLGICSTITFEETDNNFIVHNWAISCRYFEIGLEEFILLYIHSTFTPSKVSFKHHKTKYNNKVEELISKYPDAFSVYKESIDIQYNDLTINTLQSNTSLKLIQHE